MAELPESVELLTVRRAGAVDAAAVARVPVADHQVVQDRRDAGIHDKNLRVGADVRVGAPLNRDGIVAGPLDGHVGCERQRSQPAFAGAQIDRALQARGEGDGIAAAQAGVVGEGFRQASLAIVGVVLVGYGRDDQAGRTR